MDKVEKLAGVYDSLVSAGACRNKKEFAALLGVNYNGLTRAMNGDPQYLTDSLVAKATALLAGRAAYTFTPSAGGGETLPVLPMGARAGTLADWSDTVHDYDCERIVSPIRGADYAIQVTGDSMSPAYPSGSQILIKRIKEEAFIAWGETFLLDTVNGPILKIVRKCDVEGAVECVSINPAYQPFTVKCTDILGWYRVLMCLSLK